MSSVRFVKRALLLSAATVGVLSVDPAGFNGHGAYAQTTEPRALPPVSVDAPRARPQRRATARPSAAPSNAATTQRNVSQQPVAWPKPSTATIGNPPAPYAGGQVATGGSLGMLGNRGVMDTPFNQTNYTAEFVQNQQARTVRDVLLYDPSIRVVQAAGGGADTLFIRGFYYDSGDFLLNGMAGIAPYYSTIPNFIERVEVLKGPSALLNGMTTGGTGSSPGGAVGGSINLVTKHATDIDITQVTAKYMSKSNFGLETDISRRYGARKEWGIRFNGSYANGSTAWDRQKDENGNAVLGLDYRGENARISLDGGYQADSLDLPMRFFTVGSTIIPPPPSAGHNIQQSWSYYKPKDTFATAKAEFDLTNNLTAYGSFGYHYSTIDYRMASPIITNGIPGVAAGVPGTPTFQLGGVRSNPFLGTEIFETYASEAGLRAEVDTGPVHHAINFGYSRNDRQYDQVVRIPSTGFIYWNMYNVPSNPLPNFNTTAANQVTNVSLSGIGASNTMSILDKRVQLTLGVRRQTAGSDVTNYLAPASNRPDQETSAWTPAYALVVKPLNNVSLYANYIEGLQSPYVVTGAFDNRGTVFAPGQTKQFETGVKIDLGRFTTTMSYFNIEQPSVITVGTVQLENGLQRNKGFELNVFGEVMPSVRLLGGIATIDGRQANAAVAANNGKKAVGVPEFYANVGAEWDTPFIRDLTLTGTVVYTSKAYVDAANTVEIPDWTRYDIGARYTFTNPANKKPIVVRAKVENVLNTAYWAAAYSGVITAGAPRTYVLSTTFNF